MMVKRKNIFFFTLWSVRFLMTLQYRLSTWPETASYLLVPKLPYFLETFRFLFVQASLETTLGVRNRKGEQILSQNSKRLFLGNPKPNTDLSTNSWWVSIYYNLELMSLECLSMARGIWTITNYLERFPPYQYAKHRIRWDSRIHFVGGLTF